MGELEIVSLLQTYARKVRLMAVILAMVTVILLVIPVKIVVMSRHLYPMVVILIPGLIAKMFSAVRLIHFLDVRE